MKVRGQSDAKVLQFQVPSRLCARRHPYTQTVSGATPSSRVQLVTIATLTIMICPSERLAGSLAICRAKYTRREDALLQVPNHAKRLPLLGPCLAIHRRRWTLEQAALDPHDMQAEPRIDIATHYVTWPKSPPSPSHPPLRCLLPSRADAYSYQT